MARLIDADDLAILLHDDIDGLDEEFPNDKQVMPYMCGVRMALSFIETAPTIDAVPVVRCKDCKWWTKQEKSIQGRCALTGTYPTGGWYCGNGERKDDE